MASRIDGVALAAIGAGGLLVYSGVRGKSVLGGVQGLIQGKSPATAPAASQITGTTTTSSTAGQNSIGPGAPGGSPSQNQAIAKLLAAKYGWSSGPEWDALVSLWDSESGWSNTIWNVTASCGNGAYAYGIVQACGHGAHKQTAHSAIGPYPIGNPGNPPEYGGTSNAAAQINWGLAYIHANYGSPVNTPHGGY